MHVVTRRDVNKITRGGLTVEDFESIIVNFLNSIEEGISAVREELPESDNKETIMTEYERVARAKLPRRLEMVGAFVGIILVLHGVVVG